MLFYYHCRIVNGVEDITDFFICIIIIDRVYLYRRGMLMRHILILFLQVACCEMHGILGNGML